MAAPVGSSDFCCPGGLPFRYTRGLAPFQGEPEEKRMLAAVLLATLLGATAVSPAARAAFQRGEKALEAGQLDEAALDYQEALRTAPSYAEALNGLGSVLFRQGKRAEAVTKFQAAIAADSAVMEIDAA